MELENTFFDTSDYILLNKLIGKGAYGDVYVVKSLKDGQEYAAKLIHINNKFNGYHQMLLLREILILHKLNHPTIVKYKGVNFQSFSDNEKFQPTIITEYMTNGSLERMLKNERLALAGINWTATKKYIILLGISDAMRYLHHHGIIHRDLKPENILIDLDYYPRICDFGYARYLPESKLALTGRIGTPFYMAPELFRGNIDYGKGVDVYAFSILTYEVVTSEEPYKELDKNIATLDFTQMIISGYRPNLKNKRINKKMENLLSNVGMIILKKGHRLMKFMTNFQMIFHISMNLFQTMK